VTFSLERAFRGVENENATVPVKTGMSGADCGVNFEFKPGERYVVYAYRSKDGGLTTGLCTRTRRVVDAAEDLAFLSQLPFLPTGGQVFGVVTYYTRDLAFGQSRRSPLPVVHLLLRGPGGVWDVETDEDGRYHIAGVSPGDYELQAIPPAVFNAEHLRRTVNIRDPRACFASDFSVPYDGRISGALTTADGQPAAGVQVELVSGRAPWTSETLTTKTNRDGEFEFGNLSPAGYSVGVSLRRGLEPELLYPKTFYPGTPSETYAEVFELGEGTHLRLDPLRLPPALPTRDLIGTVAWQDGRATSGAIVVLVDEKGERGVSQSRATSDADGRFRLRVHDGMTYRVKAH
jgi:hypothetical protein